MKRKIIYGIMIILISNVSDDLYGQSLINTKSLVSLGVSQINITPDEPTIMSGFGARTTPFTKVHDSLFASALFFTSDNEQLLLITADLAGFSSSLNDEIRSMISSRINISFENIMLTATHTHGGPLTNPERNKNYVDGLKEKLVNVSLDASRNVVPIKMGMERSIYKMNMNRRELYAAGYFFLGLNPDAPCDHDLDVVKFIDMKGNLLAVLVNWAAHGTSGGQDNLELTGDWPGAAARFIKQELGNDVVVAVTAGASGNTSPIYDLQTNFRKIEAIGFHLANKVLETFDQIPTFPVSSIKSTNEVMLFPGRTRGGSGWWPPELEPGPDVEIRLSVFKIGALVLVGVSGELFIEIGIAVKEQSPYANTMVVTHCNGSSGYICTDASFAEGGYEIRTTRLMPGVEKPLVMKCLELINSL
jgi:neutral ceramidase